MVAVIDSIMIFRDAEASGVEDYFVVARSGQESGWYGPVNGSVASFVRDRIAEVVVGHPVDDHRGLHERMRVAVIPFSCVPASWAVGSVDCAVWDLHARLDQVPVAALLSPTPARRVPLYASWLRLDISDPTSLPAVADVGQAGWSFTKWGVRCTPGAAPGEEAERLAAATHLVAATLGTAAAFDAVFTWDEAFATDFVGRIQSADFLWLEDPLPHTAIEFYRSLIRTVPLATGERVMDHDDGLAPLSIQLRAFTIDVVGCGGLTRAVDLVAAANKRSVKVYPHGRSFVPAVHLAAAHPEAIPAVEYRLQWEPNRQRRYASPLQPNHGTVDVPASPGLGAEPRSR